MLKNFETTFLDLAATISIFTSIYPEFKIINSKVICSFPVNDEVYKAIARFNSNDLIPVFDFSQRLRKIRSQMMSLKRNNQEL
jgi:hypothetical protein